MLAADRFAFEFAHSYRPLGRLFGITPESAWVEVGEDELRARFGPWGMTVPFSNISAIEPTGPYRYFKTAGGARLGVTDAGLTFATNGQRGLLISFHRRLRSTGPYKRLRHPELTVTVADVDGLAARLRAAGVGT